MILFAAICSVASAAAVPLTSVTPNNFYTWCGRSALSELLPDTTPPAVPSGCHGEYDGSTASLTAQFASTAGRITVSEYAHNDHVNTAVHLSVNGVQVGAQINIPPSTDGWYTFPALNVQSSDVVTVVTGSSYRYSATDPDSGHMIVDAVHMDVVPWQSPVWSQFGTPGNFATTPIPSNVALDSTTGPLGYSNQTEVPRQIALQAQGVAYANFSQYTEHTAYVPLNTPLQPVRMCRTNPCVPNWGQNVDDAWRMFMGLPANATPNRTDGTCATNCTYQGGGVPITAAVQPSPGTDAEAVVCLGGGDSGDPPWQLKNADGTAFTRPDGEHMTGNCWEVWQLRADPTYNPNLPVSPSNTQWMIAWGTHRTGFIRQPGSNPSLNWTQQLDPLSGSYCPKVSNNVYRCGNGSGGYAQSWYGPDVLNPGAADSTTYDAGWGVTAAEIPLLTDVVQQHDCQQVLDGTATDFGHAIGIQLRYDRYLGAHWWPAGNSDGNNGWVAPVEGMRLYWPSNVTMPSVLNAGAQAVFRTAEKYGFVIDDTTGGGTNIAFNNYNFTANSDGSTTLTGVTSFTGVQVGADLFGTGTSHNSTATTVVTAIDQTADTVTVNTPIAAATGTTFTAQGTVKSGGALNVRYEIPAPGATNACTTLGGPDLADLPWGSLKLIAQGTDTNANPTS